MKNFQQNLQKLEAADTQVLGVSMDSAFANKAFADQIGVTFPLLSDWGGKVTHEYGIYKNEYQAPRRVNFLIGKDGKIMEEQVDKDAIDPTKIVDACQRPKLKNNSNGSDWTAPLAAKCVRFRKGCCSGLGWRLRFAVNRSCWCWTNPSMGWIRHCWARCRTFCARSRNEAPLC